MDLAQALDIVVAETNHTRFRALCDPASPIYDARYIPIVIEMAGGPPRPRPAPPAGRPPCSAPSPAGSPIPLAGDLVAAAAARLGADRLAKWVAGRLGRECGCARRRAKLNQVDRALRRWLGWE
jgi:hypothetical protein